MWPLLTTKLHIPIQASQKKKKKEKAQQNCALERRYKHYDGQDMIGAFIE